MAASHHIARKALMEIHRLRETKRKIFAEAIRRFEQRRILALRKKLTS